MIQIHFGIMKMELMHPETRALLEKLLHMLAEKGEEETYRYIRREVLRKKEG